MCALPAGHDHLSEWLLSRAARRARPIRRFRCGGPLDIHVGNAALLFRVIRILSVLSSVEEIHLLRRAEREVTLDNRRTTVPVPLAIAVV